MKRGGIKNEYDHLIHITYTNMTKEKHSSGSEGVPTSKKHEEN